MSCPECVTGSLHSGTPTGTETKVGGISSYTVGSEDSRRVVIIGTDIFGWRLVNTRLLADTYASKGFRVVVPDLFSGMSFMFGCHQPQVIDKLRYTIYAFTQKAGSFRNGP